MITDLRLKAKVCKYKDQEDRKMRDQIIYGIASKETRRELLKVAELSTAEAVKICLAMESSNSQLEAFRRPAENKLTAGVLIDDSDVDGSDLNAMYHGNSHRWTTWRRNHQNSAAGSEHRADNNKPTTRYRAGVPKRRTCGSYGRTHPQLLGTGETML